MDTSHVPRNNAQTAKSYKRTPSHGRLWLTMRLGLIRHRPNLTVDMLIGTLFINHYDFWHLSFRTRSCTLALPAGSNSASFKTFKSSNPTTTLVNEPICITHNSNIEVEETPTSIRVGHQIFHNLTQIVV